jgi:hypothetical protein
MTSSQSMDGPRTSSPVAEFVFCKRTELPTGQSHGVLGWPLFAVHAVGEWEEGDPQPCLKLKLMGTNVKKGEPWPHPHLVPEFLLMDP